jgi:competence protein ComEC
LSVLDVGQGLSAFVRTRNHTLLYDTGARFSPGFDAGTAVVVPYLRHLGVKHLDMLVVSHGDTDHIGGMQAVLDSVVVSSRLTSVPGKVPNSESCVAGQSWVWDGVVFRVLNPGTSDPARHNNASCVLRITGHGGSALLTGDIEIEAESALAARFGELLRSDVLLVPHQGSRTSSSERFIDLVAPAIALVSTGYLNRYGHPADAVVQRYHDRNIPIFNTARDGAVTVRVTAGEIAVMTYRNSHRKYWFADSGNLMH